MGFGKCTYVGPTWYRALLSVVKFINFDAFFQNIASAGSERIYSVFAKTYCKPFCLLLFAVQVHLHAVSLNFREQDVVL